MNEDSFKITLLDCAFTVHKVLNEAERKIRHLEYDSKINEKCLFQMQEVAQETNKMIADLKNIVDAQGQKGTWDISPYMCGLFNGLEMALSIFEKREPKYRDVPNAVGGQFKKSLNNSDDVLGASEYICERADLFKVKSKEVL